MRNAPAASEPQGAGFGEEVWFIFPPHCCLADNSTAMFLFTHPLLCTLPYFIEYNYMEFLLKKNKNMENTTVEVSTKIFIFQVKLVQIKFVEAHANGLLVCA